MFQLNTYAVVVVLCNTFYCFKYKPSITRLQKSSIECLTISKLPITVKLYSERLYHWKNVMSNISTTPSRSRGVLRFKFTGEHVYWSVISINLQSNFMNVFGWVWVRHGCSPVNFLHIFRTPLPKNTWLWTVASDNTRSEQCNGSWQVTHYVVLYTLTCNLWDMKG